MIEGILVATRFRFAPHRMSVFKQVIDSIYLSLSRIISVSLRLSTRSMWFTTENDRRYPHSSQVLILHLIECQYLSMSPNLSVYLILSQINPNCSRLSTCIMWSTQREYKKTWICSERSQCRVILTCIRLTLIDTKNRFCPHYRFGASEKPGATEGWTRRCPHIYQM